MRPVTLELPTSSLVTAGLLPEGSFRRFDELERAETSGLELHGKFALEIAGLPPALLRRFAFLRRAL